MAAQVVQAKCPGCKQVLRIPAAWVNQAFRCKHCGAIIQGKPKSAPVPIAPPAPATAAQPPPSPPPASAPVAENPLVFDGPIITPPSRYRRRQRSWGCTLALVAAGFLAVALGGGAGAAFFLLPPGSLPFGIGSTPSGATTDASPTDGAQPAKTPDGEPEKPAPPASKGLFPRRALIISVNNYLYANPVSHGMPTPTPRPRFIPSNVSSLTENLPRALHIPANQIVELSDAAERNPHAPLKSVIQETIAGFLGSCRAQDCVLLFFIGHVVEIGDEAYLVPIEGELGVKETLVPLKWVYDQLSRCKARQKVLIMDVSRFDPSRGLERPDGGALGEKLDGLLQQPPAGVQVWSACTAKQHSYELSDSFTSDGVFLSKLYDATNPDLTPEQGRLNLGIQRPQDPIPIDKLAAEVNARTEREVTAQLKVRQTPRLTGNAPANDGTYDPQESLPPAVALKRPPAPNGGVAGKALIDGILKETEVIPPVKTSTARLEYETLPPFSAKTMEAYKPDYDSLADLRKEIRAKPDKYPLRKAVLDAADVLQKHQKSFPESYPGGPTSAQKKAMILREQEEPARIIAELTEALEELREAGKQRAKEESKRWQANYDYVEARLTGRIAYVYEYNLMLGRIRKDDMPELDLKVHSGWRLASLEKLHVKEAKDFAGESQAALDKLIKEHPGTPWEVLARRERLTALGLEWQPARYGGGSGE
jgi:hypothetical protein